MNRHFRYNMELIIENMMNLVQNEPFLCDRTRNASEEEKDFAWKCIADILGTPNGKIVIVAYYFRTYTLCVPGLDLG
jgi:hypothetical protein